MTKSELIAYFEAIHAEHRLVTIDNNDTLDVIHNKLQQVLAIHDNETLHVEIFQNENNIASYSLIRCDEETFTLWQDRASQINQSNLKDIAKFIFDSLPHQMISPYDKYVEQITDNGKIIIKSFSDPNYSLVLNPHNIAMDVMGDYILGQYLLPDGRLEYHAINHEDLSVFKDIFASINDDKIRLFAETVAKIIPEYVFQIPAGISGQYNSASDLADKGLIRHIQDSHTILMMILTSDYAKIKFSPHERDMMIVANMFCDAFKHGWQEDYIVSHMPHYDHPKLAADIIKSIKGILSINELNFIANCIESHMGHSVVNRPDNCDIELPAPDTDYKYLLLLVQHLTGQKDLIIRNSGNHIYTFNTDKITALTPYEPVAQADIDILREAMNVYIDMQLAQECGINHAEIDIIDVWSTIIKTKLISEKQKKYLDLAKKLISQK